MAATTTVSLTGNSDIDGVLSGTKWSSTNITYSFPTTLSHYGYSKTGFEPVNAEQVAAIRAVLAMFESYTNLRFTEIAETASTHATLRFGEESNAGTAYAYLPSTSAYGGDVWFNHEDYNTPLRGTYAYSTVMHEIGHALGLDHGQDGVAALPYAHDSLEYSMMTYRSYVGSPGQYLTAAQGSYPQTAMMADIAALQYMYGANYGTNAGDTRYTWSPSTGEMSINGAIQGRSTTNKIFQTVWDGGGNDTYDFSNYTSNLKVDLQPGTFSTTSAAQLALLGYDAARGNIYAAGNIANAYLHNNNPASLIENAVGGSGNDVITGNLAGNALEGGAGSDNLYGLGGNDTLRGGAGVDFVDGGDGLDTYSFRDAVAGQNWNVDMIAGTAANPAGVERFASIENMLAGAGNDTINGSLARNVIHGGEGNDIVNAFAGDDDLYGEGGDDVLSGGAGADYVDGGSGTDTFYFQQSATGWVLDLLGGTAATGGVVDRIANIENVLGGSGNDSISGSLVRNVLRAGDGNDTLTGFAGDDDLHGEGGDDSLSGGAGADFVDGGAGSDTFAFQFSPDAWAVDMRAGTATAGGFTDRFTNIENILAGTGDDVLIGDSLANRLSGNDGKDKLNGGGGNDVLAGGGGADIFAFDANFARDVITDWNDALDLLDFTGLAGDGVRDVSALTFGAEAGSATITWGSNIIVFQNYNAGFDTSDWLFA